jgi:hypothetical protein
MKQHSQPKNFYLPQPRSAPLVETPARREAALKAIRAARLWPTPQNTEKLLALLYAWDQTHWHEVAAATPHMRPDLFVRH